MEKKITKLFKTSLFIVIIVSVIYAAPYIWMYLAFALSSDSNENKMKDTREAFNIVQYDKRVIDNIKAVDKLNNIIVENIDSILSFNNLILSPKKRHSISEQIRLFDNTYKERVPKKIANEIEIILKKMPKHFLGCTSVYDNGTIMYSIIPEKRPTKSYNYREYHKLNYGRKERTNSISENEFNHISKDTIIGNYQYYIKIEPYTGW